MSERVFFIFVIPSVNIKKHHVDRFFKDAEISLNLQKCISEILGSKRETHYNSSSSKKSHGEEVSSSHFVRLMLMTNQPEYIEYNYSSKKSFEDIIPSNFVDQFNALLHNGNLMKIERLLSSSSQDDEKKFNKNKKFVLYNVEEYTKYTGKKTETICSRTSALLSTFIQQCQLVSKRHKLLPYVKAWQENKPVDCTGFTAGRELDINIRLSCCFNNLVVMMNRRTSVCKLGILQHNCLYHNNKNFRFLVHQEALKWYASSPSPSS